MDAVVEAREEVLWTAAFALITGMLLFSVVAATSWAATMLGAWTASF